MAGGCTWGDVVNTRAALAVHGPRPLLRAFRKRVIEELKHDAPEIGVTELHEDDQLHFQLAAPNGVPFPTLVAISAQYPDCVAIVQWTQDSADGETTIQNGQVKSATLSNDSAVSNGRRPQYVCLAPDGSLVLAVALDITPDGIAGFCATCFAETYFKLRVTPAATELITIGGDKMVWDESWCGIDASAITINEPLALTGNEQRRLDQLTTAMRSEWLWYAHAPAEDTIVERQRFANANQPVQAINVKSHKIAALMASAGEIPSLASHLNDRLAGSATNPLTSNLTPDQCWIINLIESTWARR